MKKYTFVHLFLHNSIGFNRTFVDMIVENADYFDSSEHLFVTAYKPLYDEVNSICNVELYENVKKSNIELINIFGNRGAVLIAHSFPQKWFKDFNVDEELLDKLVWRTWGHDTEKALFYPDLFSIIKHYKWILCGDYKLVINDIKTRKEYKNIAGKITKFRAIGTGDEIVDKYVINRNMGIRENDFFILPYAKREEYPNFEKNKENKSKDGYYHVLVGHSGQPINNHIAIIERLKKYENDKIKLHFILSYGDESYIDKVVTYINANWSGEYEIIQKPMVFSEYAYYISMMDSAILDGKASYALGNLAMLMFFGKKIFLNSKGILAQCLKERQAIIEYTDVLGKVSFEKLCEDNGSKNNSKGCYRVYKYSEVLELWKTFFDEMKVGEGDGNE